MNITQKIVTAPPGYALLWLNKDDGTYYATPIIAFEINSPNLDDVTPIGLFTSREEAAKSDGLLCPHGEVVDVSDGEAETEIKAIPLRLIL